MLESGAGRRGRAGEAKGGVGGAAGRPATRRGDPIGLACRASARWPALLAKESGATGRNAVDAFAGVIGSPCSIRGSPTSFEFSRGQAYMHVSLRYFCGPSDKGEKNS